MQLPQAEHRCAALRAHPQLGKLTTARLTPQAVYHIQHTGATAAGVAIFSPHDLGRAFAGDLLDAGVALATVQKLMGHSDANTIARYDRRGERAKRQAVRLLHVPYQRRVKDEQEGTRLMLSLLLSSVVF